MFFVGIRASILYYNWGASWNTIPEIQWNNWMGLNFSCFSVDFQLRFALQSGFLAEFSNDPRSCLRYYISAWDIVVNQPSVTVGTAEHIFVSNISNEIMLLAFSIPQTELLSSEVNSFLFSKFW